MTAFSFFGCLPAPLTPSCLCFQFSSLFFFCLAKDPKDWEGIEHVDSSSCIFIQQMQRAFVVA
jgi:hypothetical protein